MTVVYQSLFVQLQHLSAAQKSLNRVTNTFSLQQLGPHLMWIKIIDKALNYKIATKKSQALTPKESWPLK